VNNITVDCGAKFGSNIMFMQRGKKKKKEERKKERKKKDVAYN
jgi:hypothetical protein